MRIFYFLICLLIIPLVSAGITQTYKETCADNGHSDWVAHINIRNGSIDKITNNLDYDLEVTNQSKKYFVTSSYNLAPMREHERISSNSFSFDSLDRDRVLVCLDDAVYLRAPTEVPEYDLLAIPLILSLCLVGIYKRKR